MDYKNFLLRFVFSILIISIYFIISFLNFEMIFYLISLLYLLILVEVILYFKHLKFLLISYILLSFIFIFNIDFTIDEFLKFNYFIMIIITLISFHIFLVKFLVKQKYYQLAQIKL